MTVKASDVAALFYERLALVTVANGYNTDIGLNVLRGKGSLNLEDLPAIVMVEGDDDVGDQRGPEIKVSQQYIFEGHSTCDPDHPNDMAHLIIKDLKRAIFGGDATYDGRFKAKDWLAYQGRAIGTRADGTTIVAASIIVRATFVESLIDP